MLNSSKIVVFAILVGILSGCSSVNIRLKSQARPPVSATAYVHNGEKKAVGPSGYKVIKRLEKKKIHWKILWSMIDLTNENVDPFTVLCAGESACPAADDTSGKYALVNVESSLSVGWFDYATLFLGFMVPVVPTTHDVDLSADLVELKN